MTEFLIESSAYSLIDSGDGLRLERFGEKLLVRPARSAIWRKAAAQEQWRGADAVYDHKAGWSFRRDPFESWIVDLGEYQLTLRTLRNGQIGLFPEHISYLKLFQEKGFKRVLNLFAYSGMATVAAAKSGAEVTHVDLSKSANQWAIENFTLNQIPAGQIRIITEDVSSFLQKERRRDSLYDCVLLDPPSFSRVSRKIEWSVEDQIHALLGDASRSLRPGGSLICTSHSQVVDEYAISNILIELGGRIVERAPLVISEHDTDRSLRAGSFVQAVF